MLVDKVKCDHSQVWGTSNLICTHQDPGPTVFEQLAVINEGLC
jgi:hypothetical protein